MSADGAATLFHGEDVVEVSLPDVPRRIDRSSLLWVDLPARADLLSDVVGRLGADELVDVSSNGTLGVGVVDDPSVRHLRLRAPAAAHERAEAADGVVDLDCIAGERWVLTIHEAPVAALEALQERAGGVGATGLLNGTDFLLTLVEWVLTTYTEAFEDLGGELEELEVSALQGRLDDPEEALRALVGLRRHLGALQRALGTLREPILALAHPELGGLEGERVGRARFVAQRYEATVEAGRDARAAIIGSFDVVMARTEHRTNEILKVLTIVSVLLLPGTLLAGVMGMNFRVGLFEHPEVFWAVIGVILVLATATMLVARRRGWL